MAGFHQPSKQVPGTRRAADAWFPSAMGQRLGSRVLEIRRQYVGIGSAWLRG